MTSTKSSFLSVVVPAYNEAQNLPSVVSAILQYALPLFDEVEILIVNDGSRDNTSTVLAELARHEPSIRPINFSRNFGKEAALEAGLHMSRGDAIIFIDADLQHPPSLIPTLVEKWRDGADVVNAKKLRRGKESPLYSLASKLFYRMFSNAAGVDFRGASDYKLIDREVANALRRCTERSRFFRGLVAWVGFDQAEVLFDVQPRSAGESSWSIIDLIRYSIRNLVTFSSLPLTLIAFSGFIAALISLLLMTETLVRFMLGKSLSGFTTTIISQTAFSGVILSAVGVLALYIGRIYEEQKGRPLYIVRENPSRLGPNKRDAGDNEISQC